MASIRPNSTGFVFPDDARNIFIRATLHNNFDTVRRTTRRILFIIVVLIARSKRHALYIAVKQRHNGIDCSCTAACHAVGIAGASLRVFLGQPALYGRDLIYAGIPTVNRSHNLVNGFICLHIASVFDALEKDIAGHVNNRNVPAKRRRKAVSRTRSRQHNRVVSLFIRGIFDLDSKLRERIEFLKLCQDFCVSITVRTHRKLFCDAGRLGIASHFTRSRISGHAKFKRNRSAHAFDWPNADSSPVCTGNRGHSFCLKLALWICTRLHQSARRNHRTLTPGTGQRIFCACLPDAVDAANLHGVVQCDSLGGIREELLIASRKCFPQFCRGIGKNRKKHIHKALRILGRVYTDFILKSFAGVIIDFVQPPHRKAISCYSILHEKAPPHFPPLPPSFLR